MIKTILKESIIILLLCVVIILLLSILFYDDNPINKVIPNKIAYTTPESVQNALQQEVIENTIEMQNRVYVIEGTDLNIYQKDKTYNPSKENPFVATSETSGNTNVGGTTTPQQSGQNGGTTTPQTNGGTTGKTGLK